MRARYRYIVQVCIIIWRQALPLLSFFAREEPGARLACIRACMAVYSGPAWVLVGEFPTHSAWHVAGRAHAAPFVDTFGVLLNTSLLGRVLFMSGPN